MSFDNEERAALRSSVRGLLAKHSDSAAVRRAMTTEHGYDEALWSRLCDQIGVAALAVPEKYGGVGASLLEIHVVQEELGRTLTPSPMLGSAVLATQALVLSGDVDACSRLLPTIAEGAVAALCWADSNGWSNVGVTASGDTLSGTASYVLGADIAEVLLVLTSDGLYQVDPSSDGVHRRRLPTMDPTRSLSEVSFDAAAARRIESPPDLVEQVRTIALIALSAEQVGAASAALEMTVAYTKARTQFGRSIGSFQALKHRMADMYVSVEAARSMSCAAALSGTHEDAVAAKICCSEALQHVAAETIQMHGGIAITWDHDAQLFFKRAHGAAQLFGLPRDYLTDPACWPRQDFV
ncbi:acyl-CoA dehydrogenase family protein [Rhodococcoides yunnanense]|uniref:acyl-CoA dehydrogenase family protein n=1 Tax=Rhodococcoides yunnanense TaxID=278209 RepID=UPI00093313D9|nr:acyl-CoA dehydrogenase family protein [Rhodococcus yunnanensis]